MTTKVPSGQLGISVPPGELWLPSRAAMNAELDDYVSLGVEWVRMDIEWHNIQSRVGGPMNWSVFDELVSGIESRGMRVVGVLHGAPEGVSRDMARHHDRVDFAAFAEAAVTRYRGIEHWEVINEPNKMGITPEKYAALLELVHDRIEAVEPGDMVISGGTAAVPYTANGFYGAVEYLERMYAAGAGGHFDAVGYHPYTHPLYPSDDENWNGWEIMEDGIRPTMVANGDADLQVWMTELGAPTGGSGDAITDDQQVRILTEAVEIARQTPWAGPIMWYSYQDRGWGGSTENHFGLLRPDGSEKPAYWAFRDLAGERADEGRTVQGGAVEGGAVEGRTVEGGAGDDALAGGAGDDVIRGGGGNDRLTGGAGADRFVFEGADFGWDTIADFGAGDRIDLRGVDAVRGRGGDQAFGFIGSAWLDEPGDLGVYVDRGRDLTFVQGDVDGDGGYDFSIRLEGRHALEASDFLL